MIRGESDVAIHLSRALKAELEWLAGEAPPVLARHARIVLGRSQGMTMAMLAARVGVHENTVRNCLRRFQESGLRGLGHRGVGKPKNAAFVDAVRDEIARLAMHSPAAAGESYPAWSLRRLRDHLMVRGVVQAISVEGLRKLLSGLPLPTAYWQQTVHPTLSLAPEVRHALESMAEGKRGDRALRAKIVLANVEGLNEAEIAAALRVGKSTARKWLRRFRHGGLLGLQSMPGRKRLREREREAILRIASASPRRFGHSRSTWSLKLLRATLTREGFGDPIDAGTLRRLILEAAEPAPGGEASEPVARPAVG